MKIFLDVNILVSVLNKEYPLFTWSSRILSLADHKRYEVFTSPLCLAIAFYFAKKEQKLAKNKISLLAGYLSITPITTTTVKKTISHPAINDLEDGLEYYVALESKCDCIITEDTGDFYFSDLEVLSSEAFFEKYLTSKK